MGIEHGRRNDAIDGVGEDERVMGPAMLEPAHRGQKPVKGVAFVQARHTLKLLLFVQPAEAEDLADPNELYT